MRKTIKSLLLIIFIMFSFFIPAQAKSIYSPNYVAATALKFGQNLYIQPDQVEKGDVVNIGGNIYLNGKVDGNAIVIGGKIFLNGEVRGDVVIIGGNIEKGQNCIVHGRIVEVGKSLSIPSFSGRGFTANNNRPFIGFGTIMGFLFLSLACYVIYKIIPSNEVRMAVGIEQNIGKNFIYGFCTMLAVPIMVIILVITLIGIIAIPFLILGLYIIYLIGFTAVAMYIGKGLGAALNKNLSGTESLVLGIVIYEIIKVLPVIGFIASTFIITPLAFGIVIATRFGTGAAWRRTPENFVNENPYWDYKIVWNNFKQK